MSLLRLSPAECISFSVSRGPARRVHSNAGSALSENQQFALITCEPNEMIAAIHDRMPVLLHPEDYEWWISSAEDPRDLMKPFPADLITMWMIGRNVGSAKNDSPDIIEEIDPEPNLL
jgi:putative SOS response-associated peptidase YedK